MPATDLHNSKNNPYFAELNACAQQLSSLNVQRKADQSLLDAKLAHKPEEDKKLLAELEKQLSQVDDTLFDYTHVLYAKPSGFLSWLSNPFGASKFEREAKERARELNERRASLKTTLRQKIAQIQSHATRVAGIDEYKQRALIRTADCQIELVTERLAATKAKSAQLLDRIATLIQSADNLDTEMHTLEQDLADATRMDSVLGSVPANKRYEIHNQCADRFRGEGSPRKVINNVRRQLDGASRQKDKITAKIADEVRKLHVVIKRVFIDGNNLCTKQAHNRKMFIGTAAVEALATELLAQGYEVTVVFDQKIGAGNDSLSFQRVLQNFEEAVKVEQAPPRTPADELLMSFANEDQDCILSNDRFVDYGHKKLVQDKRVFRVLISDHLVAVPFLNLEVPYSAPSGASWS
ncbi:NYN domain-containing protein [Comamonas thiooxydans]|uniref:NYN domain-containing protein n=1 Tax=Comamonas thiooxydans TaxID=363952 RepID=UPI000B40C02F|nr:hypothetical protein [Comamonas thiooxydans]